MKLNIYARITLPDAPDIEVYKWRDTDPNSALAPYFVCMFGNERTIHIGLHTALERMKVCLERAIEMSC